MKFVWAATLLPALFLGACSPAPKAENSTGPLASSSFENMDGWLADAPARASLTRDKAHTGEYSTVAGPGHEFSLGYSNTLSRLAPDWPAKLTIGAWVLLPNDQAAAKLVTEIKGPTNNGPSIFWEGVDLSQTVKVYNKWQYVEQTITMPPTAKATDRLLVYLWRADSKQPVYLDDLTIALATQ